MYHSDGYLRLWQIRCFNGQFFQMPAILLFNFSIYFLFRTYSLTTNTMDKVYPRNFTPLLSSWLSLFHVGNHFDQFLMSPPSVSFLQIQANMKKYVCMCMYVRVYVISLFPPYEKYHIIYIYSCAPNTYIIIYMYRYICRINSQMWKFW